MLKKIQAINIDRLSSIYTVLNDIYTKFLVTEDFSGLSYGVPQGIGDVSAEDQKEIIAFLIFEGNIIGNWSDGGYIEPRDEPPYHVEPGFHLEFSKKFNNYYGEVKREIERRKVLSRKPTFDEENSILSFMEYKIKISRQQKRSREHGVLKYIFNRNLSSYALYSEMEEEYTGDPDSYKNEKVPKNYYNYCSKINKIIEKETKDKVIKFLNLEKNKQGKVKVNSKYL